MLIRAAAAVVDAGVDVRLTLVGEGRLRPALERLATALGCRERVVFSGHLSSPAAVRAALDDADLFVLPSRTEGLPRAMVEAMARRLPCIGSAAGGIPELLPGDALVPPGDAAALSRAIREMLADPSRMARHGQANLERARLYRQELLQARRVEFYRCVRAATEQWLQASRGNVQGGTQAVPAVSR